MGWGVPRTNEYDTNLYDNIMFVAGTSSDSFAMLLTVDKMNN
jgi:hypothetical protein